MSDAFIGTWQRVCTTSQFGTFAVGSDLRSYVVVEPTEGGALAWKFGGTLEALRVGYVTQVAPAGGGAASGFTPLTVSFGAGAGHGGLRADGLACTLTLMNSGVLVTVVYRVLDADTLALSMTEVPSKAEDAEKATLSQGFLFRVFDGGAAKPPPPTSPARGSA